MSLRNVRGGNAWAVFGRQQQQQQQQLDNPCRSVLVLAYKTSITNKTMSESSYGPIADIRHATESPLALTVGSLFGGAAPLVNYFTVHLGNLVWFDEVHKEVHVTLQSPLWFLVAGSFALSSKSVFRWARNTFGDVVSATGTVAMLEGALILAPHPAMGVSALVFLVAINAAAYGSALGLRDQKDKAMEKAAKLALSPAEQPEQQQQELVAQPQMVPVESLPPETRALSPEEQPEQQQQEVVARPQMVPVESLPPETRARKALPARKSKPVSDMDGLYEEAVTAVRACSSVSVETLREALGIRQPTAAELMARLVRNGVVGDSNPSDYGRRPVLIRSCCA
jgi:hypothetical protein